MGEVIVITSGKGGVGKTTTTANIGMGLAMMDKKVLLIDIDTGLRNLDVVLGLENRIVYNLVDVIEGNCRIKQAVIRDKVQPNLYLLPTAQTRDKSSVSPRQITKLLESLRKEYDFILLDSPAGIEQGFQCAIASADRGIIVTTPDVSAIRDADRVMGLLEDNGIRNVHLLLNRLRPSLVRQGDMMSPDDVVEILGIPLIGVIPDDEAVVIATNQGTPLVQGNSLPGQAYQNIVRRILGEEVPFLKTDRRKGLFSRLFQH
ncbi:MAG: septum site-determining protein MinD [Clostridiales bacterium]|nr:septum site-determining protein MinD [Clostridiales bacterium]